MYCTVQYIASQWSLIQKKGTYMTKKLGRPLQRGLSNSIRVVHPNELSAGTLQTPGSLRMAAISASRGIVSPIWGGTFLVDPSAKTAIHHHGKQDTIVYVLEGEALVRWGDRGEYSATVRPGDFLCVPSWLPHQELNPSNEYPFRWVVVRSTPEPIVVNLPDDYWTTDQEEQTQRSC
jgi:uncharacterized RmlC-like cupin family protein